MTPPVPMPAAHLFTHEAMHTNFTLRFIDEDGTRAAGLARECIELIDALEGKLSRFIDGSDISRINHLQAGETLFLSTACHQCLLLAMAAHAATGGLFDISLGTRIQHRKTSADSPAPVLTGRLVIHPDQAAVTCEAPGRELDLGGIGKGFALDQLGALLHDWDLAGALLDSGPSTILAIGPQPWPVQLAGDREILHLALQNQALSASGTEMQGSHIIHPLADSANYLSDRVWVIADTAAIAEIWSTALMLMTPDQAASVLADEPAIRHAYAHREGRVIDLRA